MKNPSTKALEELAEAYATRTEHTVIGGNIQEVDVVNILAKADFIAGYQAAQSLANEREKVMQAEIDELKLERSYNYEGIEMHFKAKLENQTAIIAKCKDALESTKQFLEIAPLQSGVCCCGSDKCNPIYDGHSFVDSGGYAIESVIKNLDKALASLETQSNEGGAR